MLKTLIPEAVSASFAVEVVTLLVTSSGLDDAPCGSEVFPLPGSESAATAVAHSTATWPWLAEAANGHHILRVRFGSHAAEPATATLTDDEASALAVAEAQAHLGVSLNVRAARRERFTQALPAAHQNAAAMRDAARTAIRTDARLAAVGAWIAGSGLSRIIPDARAEAERLRSALLWESPVSPGRERED